MSKQSKHRHNIANRKWLITLAILCLGISLVGKILWNSRRNYPINMISSGQPTIDLFIEPENMDLELGSDQLIEIGIKTNGNPILGSLLELSYDPTRLSISNIEKSDFFPNSLSESRINAGKIAISYGLDFNASAGKTGSGTIATFKVKTLSAGETSIEFTKNSQVIPSDEVPDNLVTTVNSVKLVVKDKSESPNQSAMTPSTAPSPIIKASPVATKRPIASKTSMPSPTQFSILTQTVPSPRAYQESTGTPFDQSIEQYQNQKNIPINPETHALTTAQQKQNIFALIKQYWQKLTGL